MNVMLRSLDKDLKGISDAAVQAAAAKFRKNEVAGQSDTFPPSSAKFIREAKSQHALIKIRKRPRLEQPGSNPKGIAPYLVRMEKYHQQYAGCEVLYENVDNTMFLDLHKAKKIPIGAVWVAALGKIYALADQKR